MTARQLLHSDFDQLAGAYENLGDAVGITDTEGRLIFVNSASERLHGCSKGEMIGQPVSKFVPPGQFVITDEMLREAPNERWRGEVVRMRKDGTTFHAMLTVTFLRDAKGEVIGCVAVASDLSELKSAERELEQAASQREVLAEIGRVISSSLDINEVYELFAEEVRKLIPFDRIAINLIDEENDEFRIAYATGLHVAGAETGAVKPLGNSPTARAVASRAGLILDLEDIVMSGGGPPAVAMFEAGIRSVLRVPLVARGTAFGTLGIGSTQSNFYDSGHLRLAEQIGTRIAGAISNAQLFAERIRTEGALQETEEKYRTLVENASDSIVVLQDGQTVYRNPVFTELLGYSVAETAGRSFLDNVVPEDRDRVRDYYERRQRRDDGPSQYELGLLTRSGRRVTMEVRPRLIEYGGKSAIMVMMRDITDRRELEAQLVQAQKMESIGRLAGGVAHDFNNILTVIMGYSQLGQFKLPPADSVTGYLEEIRRASGRAADLTQQLLAFSRRQIVQPRVLNLNDLILDVDAMLRRLIGEDVEVVVILEPDLRTVSVDPGQLEQVLVNLAVNARDAMPGGGKLSIETASVTLGAEYVRSHPEVPAGDYVLVTVTDTGVGMTDEVKSKVFEPFFTTKEQGQGTGLGLSTCYGIVAQSGGHIDVDSEPGRGAIFKIYLPCAEQRADSLPLHDESGYLPSVTETVLLVEDEPMVREITAHVLREQGYTVLEAANGSEGLRIAEERADQEIHLLLTDMVMPMMGGAELADRLTELRPDTRVLYTSGYTDDFVMREDPGAVFMRKPFTPDVLSRKVRDALERQLPR